MKSLLESLITRKNLSRTGIVAKDKKHLKDLIKLEIRDKGPTCSLDFIDVSNVTDMSGLFEFYKFNGDISDWDVSNVENMLGMFHSSDFNGNISEWDVSNVKNMMRMFAFSTFSQDISSWKINPKCNIESMFLECPIPEKFKPIGLY